MLKRTLMMMIGLLGAASMAVAGAPITTMTTSPGFQRSGGSSNVVKPNTNVRPMTHGIPITRGKKTDLIPLVRNPFTGVLTVKNIGGATAGASKVVISCRKAGHRGSGGGCVDSPSLNRYYNASLGGMAFPIHALRPGQSQRVNIPGWSALPWMPGGYNFTIFADGGRVVAESNERNNKVLTSLKVRGKPKPRGKKPDLIPLVRGSNPFAGTVKVKNQGGATAGASKLVLTCKKVGHRGSGGGCADSPAVNRLYNPSLGGLVASVPALRPGQVYTVNLPFKGLKWAKGKYKFTFNADATHAVAESNERNNLKRTTRRR